jgi:dihydrofolate synthase/folylpolyglutamate synthase
MNVELAVAWLEAHIDYESWAARSGRVGEVDLSLDRMRRLVASLGDPQDRFPVVHVTGTNGKGSTGRMTTRLLMAEGLRVGTYSSPHLSRYNERFRVDDVDIDDAGLASILSTVRAAEERLGERAMPFEILTAAGYAWFAEQAVDVAVVEVGVLGRYDATNVADGRVAVLTNIGFDHTSGVGDWRMRIAEEKAGIIKPGAQFVLGPVEDRFVDAFRAEQPSAIWRFGSEIVVRSNHATPTGRRFTVTTPWQTLTEVALPLHGAHQSTNCALALTAASAFLGRALEPSRAARGLACVRMPGRLESLALGSGATVILDGAHNPDAAAALARALREMRRRGRRTLVVGMLNGRDPRTMLDALDAAAFDAVVTTTPPTARARSAAEVAAVFPGAESITDIPGALAHALDDAGPDDQIVVTGSIYLVADARAWLLSNAL